MKNMSELMEESRQHHERRRRTHPVVLTENGCIHLGRHGYEVDLDRINSPRDVLAWVVHLAEKNWVDTEMLRDFAILACKQKGYDPFGV